MISKGKLTEQGQKKWYATWRNKKTGKECRSPETGVLDMWSSVLRGPLQSLRWIVEIIEVEGCRSMEKWKREDESRYGM